MTATPFLPLEYTGPYPVPVETTIHPDPPFAWVPYDLARLDAKGRAVGAQVRRLRCDILPSRDPLTPSHVDELPNGDLVMLLEGLPPAYGLRLGAGLFHANFVETRGGKPWGPRSVRRYFTSESDQEVWIQKHLNELKARWPKPA